MFIFGGCIPAKCLEVEDLFFFGVASQAFTGSVVFLKMDLRWFTGCCTTLISSLSIITLEQGRLFSLICILCVPYIYIYIYSRPKQKGKVCYYQNYGTSDMGWVSLNYGPPPAVVERLRSVLFGLKCDLPSKSPLFVGGKIRHRGNFTGENTRFCIPYC